MQICWLGHACFRIQRDDGQVLLTDPFDESVGYETDFTADVVTVSHDHFDHNAVQLVKGDPEVVKGPGTHKAAGFVITGVASFHDDLGGSQRGSNTIFLIEADRLRLCHLGDLGHALSEEQVNQVGQVDVLLVPVGGTYTIDAAGADTVVEQLQPRVVVPMHFRTPAISLPIAGVEDFLEGKQKVRRLEGAYVEVSVNDLPAEREIIVLNP